MKLASVFGAILLLAAPATGQSVRAGIDAWTKGDHAAAVAAWTPLAAKGDADAAFNLGQAYRLGKGVTIDLGRAQQYFEQAARKGHVDAAAALGILMFQNGNRTGALRWIRLAADGGEPRSMLLYGVALFNGDGIAPDPVAAYAYVSRASAQGLATAKATLADLDAAMPLDQRVKGLARAKEMVAGAPLAAAPVASAPRASKTPAPPVKPVLPIPPAPVADTGGWRIQLGAFGQRATAEALFARLHGKLGGRQAFFVSAGTIVRLQVGPYGSRSAAASACAALAGQPCFPVTAR